jgi:hypothetical protein
MIVRWLTAIVLASLMGCDPVDGAYVVQSAKVSVDANNHVVVDVHVTNTGSDDWTAARCVNVYWEKSPGVSQADARTGVLDSSVPIAETENQCSGSSKVLSAGHSDNFHIVSGGLRADLAGTTIVVVSQVDESSSFDDRIVQPSP